MQGAGDDGPGDDEDGREDGILSGVTGSATAMLYSQKASAISSMPVSMVAAIEGAFVRLTEAPWCSVFHHFTE